MSLNLVVEWHLERRAMRSRQTILLSGGQQTARAHDRAMVAFGIENYIGHLSIM